jgi:hypothetical protein
MTIKVGPHSSPHNRSDNPARGPHMVRTFGVGVRT